MNRITFTLDKDGQLVRICADSAVEVFIIAPHVPRDRVYRWSSLKIGQDQVDNEIAGWPIGDKDSMPAAHLYPVNRKRQKAINRATPKLRRLWDLQRAISRVVAFSNPQATSAKPQETCGSRRH